jgi:hypothetical protein
MAELSDLYVNLLNQASDPMRGYRAMQDQQVRNMELQNKQREFAAEQQLRELFARNANPNISEIGAISPQFAQTFGKNQMEMLQKQYEMENTQSQIDQRKRQQDFEESKIRSNALAPIAEQYTFDVQSMGEPQAREKYHRNIGGMLAQLEAQGIKIPANFDPNVATPQAVLNSAIGFGYKSPLMQQQYDVGTEQMKSGMMPRRTPEQAYGGVEMTPQGPMYKPPIPTMQPAEIPEGATSEALTDDDIRMMQQQFRALPNGSPEKARIGAMLADAVKQQLPSGRFITPEERQQRELKGKVDEETATKQAAQKLEDQKAIDSYFRGRPPEQIRQLIRESIAGDVESGVARIAKTFGVSVPGGSATAALKTITQQLIEGSPYAPGSQSNVEYIARLEKIGNPASNEPIKDRLAALDEFLRERQAFIANKAELSQEELIDAVANGFIDKESALKIRKRTLTKAGAPQ